MLATPFNEAGMKYAGYVTGGCVFWTTDTIIVAASKRIWPMRNLHLCQLSLPLLPKETEVREYLWWSGKCLFDCEDFISSTPDPFYFGLFVIVERITGEIETPNHPQSQRNLKKPQPL